MLTLGLSNRNKLKNLICKFKKKCIQSERKQRKILLLYFRQFSILKCKNKYTKQFNILIGIEKLKNKTIKLFSTLVMNKLKVNQNGIKLRKLKSFHKSLEITYHHNRGDCQKNNELLLLF